MDSTVDIKEFNTVDIFDNNLEYWLNDYCEKYDIEDLKKESQNVFHGCMQYIYMHTFKLDNSSLKVSPSIPVNNSVNDLKTSHNAYDIKKLYDLLFWYSITANTYDKANTISGFSYLSGVTKSTIYAWKEGSNKESVYTGLMATSSRSDFYKKLRELEEDSLTAIGITGKRNVVGTLEALNFSYGHNLPGVSREPAKPQANVQQIAAQMGVALEAQDVPQIGTGAAGGEGKNHTE